MDFNDRVVFALPAGRHFTSSAAELAEALTAVRAEGRTALYDGAAQGLRHLELGHGDKRALVVLSDGGDNASGRKYDEVLALARRSDAVIYAIGILGSSPTRKRKTRECSSGSAGTPAASDSFRGRPIRLPTRRPIAAISGNSNVGFTPGARPAGCVPKN